MASSLQLVEAVAAAAERQRQSAAAGRAPPVAATGSAEPAHRFGRGDLVDVRQPDGSGRAGRVVQIQTMHRGVLVRRVKVHFDGSDDGGCWIDLKKASDTLSLRQASESDPSGASGRSESARAAFQRAGPGTTWLVAPGIDDQGAAATATAATASNSKASAAKRAAVESAAKPAPKRRKSSASKAKPPTPKPNTRVAMPMGTEKLDIGERVEVAFEGLGVFEGKVIKASSEAGAEVFFECDKTTSTVLVGVHRYRKLVPPEAERPAPKPKPVRTTPFLRQFIAGLQMIILPRQARDKHNMH